MIKYSFTIQEEHFYELEDFFEDKAKEENIALILCGISSIDSDPWEKIREKRLLSKEVILIPANEIVESKINFVTWKTNLFVKALKAAEEQKLGILLVHNHILDVGNFSEIDNINERELFKLAFNRNGPDFLCGSLITLPNKKLVGRVWDERLEPNEISRIRILGSKFLFLYPNKEQGLSSAIFQRQELAFGRILNKDLSTLKVGIIGCGATGSAVGMLLTRLGVGYFLLIDNDIVEKTNLNRLHGASVADADSKIPKIDSLKNFLVKIGLGTKVEAIKDWVGNTKCYDSLKACDIIFGCTDDHEGRLFLNRLAYFYLIPVIDLGLMIKISKEKLEIEVLDGRVTVIFPPNACLLCRKIISIERARSESIKRNDPVQFEELRKEAYVLGEGEPNPAVVTFTTEVATMAANELIHRIQGFRGAEDLSNERRRNFKFYEDSKTGSHKDPTCKICGISRKYWGRGDMDPFLDRV